MSLNPDYIAGLFDGEGSVTLNHRKRLNSEIFTPVLSISNAHGFVIKELQNMFGGSLRKVKKTNYYIFELQLSNNKAYLFSKYLVRNTHIKTKELNLMIEYYECVVGKFRFNKTERINKGFEYKQKLKDLRYNDYS